MSFSKRYKELKEITRDVSLSREDRRKAINEIAASFLVREQKNIEVTNIVLNNYSAPIDSESSITNDEDFLSSESFEDETNKETMDRLHRELSVLLTKKHMSPLSEKDQARFKVLTAGLGKE